MQKNIFLPQALGYLYTEESDGLQSSENFGYNGQTSP